MLKVEIPSAEMISAMRKNGMTRQEIAGEFNVSLARVKRWITSLDLANKNSKSPSKEDQKLSTVTARSFDDGLSLMERCKIILGRRMGEDYRGYLLDRLPCSSMQIRRAAGL